MTIQASLQQALTVVETKSAADLPAAGDRSMTYDQFNVRKTLNTASTPAGTQFLAKQYASGQTLDFTALVNDLGETIDATGLKLQAMLLVNPSSSANVDWADGASDAYSINNAEGLRIPPGGSVELYFHGQLADVAAGVKDVDITATDAFQLILVFG
jgi:hypothetical protein